MSVSIQSFATKKRINWKNGPLLQAALESLRNHGLNKTAKNLNVSTHSLRFALKRRGIEARAFTKGRERARRIADRIVNVPRIETPSPLLAQEALESKPHNGCSWPMGDLAKGDFRYCGKPKQLGKSYCVACQAKAYVPGTALTEAAINRICIAVSSDNRAPLVFQRKRGLQKTGLYGGYN